MTKRKRLEDEDDLKESMRHLDEVSARISRLLADLSTSGQSGAEEDTTPRQRI